MCHFGAFAREADVGQKPVCPSGIEKIPSDMGVEINFPYGLSWTLAMLASIICRIWTYHLESAREAAKVYILPDSCRITTRNCRGM